MRAKLLSERPAMAWPAASTIGDLLRREGLSQPRRLRRRAASAHRPFLAATAPNEVWCADFKGWFRTADGQRCDPLTISDAHSRFLLDCRISVPSGDGVRPVFERVFAEFGLPRAMRTDNGPPFASIGAGGLSRLAVHWVKLGIRLEHIDPGQPQQNGRHERMHRTLKAETSAAGGQPARAAGALRCLPPALQPRAAARSARPGDAGRALLAVAQALSGAPRRALVRRRPCRPPGAHQRRNQMGRRACLHQRKPHRRDRRRRRNRGRRLDRPLRRHRPRTDRPDQQTTAPLPCAPAGAQGSAL